MELREGRLQSSGIFLSFFLSSAIAASQQGATDTHACAPHKLQRWITLTCTRRSSARRVLLALSLSLPLFVCSQTQMKRTLRAAIRRGDSTSRNSRSQWDAVRGRVYFCLDTAPCRARWSRRPTCQHAQVCAAAPGGVSLPQMSFWEVRRGGGFSEMMQSLFCQLFA